LALSVDGFSLGLLGSSMITIFQPFRFWLLSDSAFAADLQQYPH
jgi:hypothetical protein